MENIDEEIRLIECSECGQKFRREDMQFTKDCHGIPFRLVCYDCFDKIMAQRGYDGVYYGEEDECIDPEPCVGPQDYWY